MTLKASHRQYGKSPYMKVELLKRVENIVAKGEIAHHQQFPILPDFFQKSSLLPQCFQFYSIITLIQIFIHIFADCRLLQIFCM